MPATIVHPGTSPRTNASLCRRVPAPVYLLFFFLTPWTVIVISRHDHRQFHFARWTVCAWVRVLLPIVDVKSSHLSRTALAAGVCPAPAPARLTAGESPSLRRLTRACHRLVPRNEIYANGVRVLRRDHNVVGDRKTGPTSLCARVCDSASVYDRETAFRVEHSLDTHSAIKEAGSRSETNFLSTEREIVRERVGGRKKSFLFSSVSRSRAPRRFVFVRTVVSQCMEERNK